MTDRNAKSHHLGKEAAGRAAAELVKDGNIVGLGTGSTTAYAIKALGEKVKKGLDIRAVVTSYQSEMLAIQAGIPLTSLAENPVLDIAIDGADEVDSDLNVVKGGGGAHFREKVVSLSANKFIVVVDDSKISETISMAIPLEVLPCARELVQQQVAQMGGEASIRPASRKDGPVISDNGNFIMDAAFGEIPNPQEFADKLTNVVGIVEHGIFTNTDRVYIGYKDGKIELRE
ncbi:ribose 5-phosphate isomerase A [Methanohalophilus sp. WG1-DM]|uniref:ribose 5-phosphate isomerase A n=1 Tax=Methanohalophilus sp. WG1-DM TaxID=2491675 RepID=UPI000FFEB38D|nr:ribose 5-phosphate isomerase A [Methanohalophilus sp. WG1-DM]RXG35116.1 ribose 5-phosphate isomerase A [Methanohalophilus sp. WG1-DM]